MASCMVAAGARVILVGRRRQILRQTVAEIGSRAALLVHDVTHVRAAPRLLKLAEKPFGPISILINNA